MINNKALIQVHRFFKNSNKIFYVVFIYGSEVDESIKSIIIDGPQKYGYYDYSDNKIIFDYQGYPKAIDIILEPFDIEKDNVDFCMASAQKGLQAMTGLSFIVGNEEIIRKSESYPKRSYYCNLFMQYKYFEETGEMHFTPPVQTVYAMRQALKEYFEEGEENKFARHKRVYEAIY